jgi:hypothetical protein
MPAGRANAEIQPKRLIRARWPAFRDLFDPKWLKLTDEPKRKEIKMKNIISTFRFNAETRLHPINCLGTAAGKALGPVGTSVAAPGRSERTRSGWIKTWSVMLLALLWAITGVREVNRSGGRTEPG